MAGTATVTFNTPYSTANGNNTIAPDNIQFSNPVGAVTVVVLGSGTNTITIPASTTFIYIKPPDSNTETITLKGVAGDTGIRVSKTNWSWLALDSASIPANFVLTSGGAQTAATTIIFL